VTMAFDKQRSRTFRFGSIVIIREHAKEIIAHADWNGCTIALDAYAIASPVVHAQHTVALSTLIQRAKWYNLAALTRLAVAFRMDEAWTTIMQILRDDSRNAISVIEAVPWDDLHPDVQTLILSAADDDNVCAAMAYARGIRTDPPSITTESAHAFFAAVTPEIWSALMEEERRMWLSHLNSSCANLAVRSLGPTPSFLARAELNTFLIADIRRHVTDESAGRRMLFPVAVRDLLIDTIFAIIASLPVIDDPITFLQIVGRRVDMPPALQAWITAHPTTQAAAAAIALRVAMQLRHDDVAARCAAFAHVLAGWRWEETNALFTTLLDDACAALPPDPDALANALADPDRQDALRQALGVLDTLPPSIAIPAFHALDTLAQATTPSDQQHAGAELARALRDHGDSFTAIVGALDDSARSAVLPSLDDPHVGSALDALTAADPLVAHHVAHVLRADDAAVALDALAASSLEEMRHCWRRLPDTILSAILSAGNAPIRSACARASARPGAGAAGMGRGQPAAAAGAASADR